MDVRRIRAALAITATLGLAAAGIAAAAPGDVVYRGSTSEGAKVKLTVGTAGNATAFRIGKTEVSCAEGTLTNRAGTYRNFDTSDPGEFSDRSSASSDGGGYHFETKSRIRGRIGADDESWRGSFKLRTKVFERGERIDTCKLKTRWSAS